jgi:hypothetical protein
LPSAERPLIWILIGPDVTEVQDHILIARMKARARSTTGRSNGSRNAAAFPDLGLT